MAMNVISRNISSASTLNPNAPMFVPSAYRAVEDFSDQWWALVESSPWFRDYWLQECFSDSQIYDPVLPEIDALFDAYDVDVQSYTVKDLEKQGQKDLISLGSLKWRKPRLAAETPRYSQKFPKIVNVKVSPRPIQQPR